VTLPSSLDLASLAAAYRQGLAPSDLVGALLERCRRHDDPAVWIHRVADADLEARAHELERIGPQGRPLYGAPFAVKDNIDVAGLPTTSACPAFAYSAGATATAVQRLLDAGAILLGKTNLDQFATGLVGTRSPYGACRNPFDPLYIAGGSSSGSAVAVAAGLVSFALGTDTAGSGRVPAGFCNLVGVKPTPGLVSTRGVVPACRSLDCVSIFALCCGDGGAVLAAIEGYDAADPFSRRAADASGPIRRLGVPRSEQLFFSDDHDYARLYGEARHRLETLGVEVRPVDFGPLFETAALLYQGPWVAERYLAVRDLIERAPDALLPITRSIIERGRDITGAETFAGLYRLRALRRQVETIFAEVDGLVVPTAPTIWTRAEVASDPIGRNSALGTYTNFVNLLGLAAIAVPSGFCRAGLPFGITLIGPAFSDRLLLDLAARFHAVTGLRIGTSGVPVPAAPP
jgi:allophanate hydrolase